MALARQRAAKEPLAKPAIAWAGTEFS